MSTLIKVSKYNVARKRPEKKTSDRAKAIKNADLKFPIFMLKDGMVVDGFHRIGNAWSTKRKTISVIVFDNSLLKKFLLGNSKDREKIFRNYTTSFIIELFYSRFCGAKKNITGGGMNYVPTKVTCGKHGAYRTY